ncbi:unnamed protein product [Discosporangium mesarthrocarpum]
MSFCSCSRGRSRLPKICLFGESSALRDLTTFFPSPPSEPALKRPRLLEDVVQDSKKNEPVALGFSSDFFLENQSLVLLQVSDSLLGELGEDIDLGLVRLVGREDEEAVLVTGQQTFKMTKAETSNTLLLVPPAEENETQRGNGEQKAGVGEGSGEGDKGSGGQFKAIASVASQFELSKITPPVENIHKALEDTMYRGKKEEGGVHTAALHSCTMEALERRLQFSRKELLRGLKEVGAVEMQGKQQGGKWRLVDPVLMEHTINALLDLVVQEDLPLDKVDPEKCVAALPECEPLLVDHCLTVYSKAGQDGAAAAKVKEEGGGSARPCLFSSPLFAAAALCTRELDMAAVARLRAHQLLRAHPESQDKGWDLEDFMAQWASNMPGVEVPDQELLKVSAIVEPPPETFRLGGRSLRIHLCDA